MGTSSVGRCRRWPAGCRRSASRQADRGRRADTALSPRDAGAPRRRVRTAAPAGKALDRGVYGAGIRAPRGRSASAVSSLGRRTPRTDASASAEVNCGGTRFVPRPVPGRRDAVSLGGLCGRPSTPMEGRVSSPGRGNRSSGGGVEDERPCRRAVHRRTQTDSWASMDGGPSLCLRCSDKRDEGSLTASQSPAAITSDPHPFHSRGAARVGQVAAMHVPVVGHELETKTPGAKRGFMSGRDARSHPVQILFCE